MTKPSPRKLVGDRAIYVSRELGAPKEHGGPMLCDFGEARHGRESYDNDIQPYTYRAPEVILDVPWNSQVDIWSVAVMVSSLCIGQCQAVLRVYRFFASLCDVLANLLL